MVHVCKWCRWLGQKRGKRDWELRAKCEAGPQELKRVRCALSDRAGRPADNVLRVAKEDTVSGWVGHGSDYQSIACRQVTWPAGRLEYK